MTFHQSHVSMSVMRSCPPSSWHRRSRCHKVKLKIIIYHFISFRKILSYRIVSYRITSYHITAYHIISHDVISHDVISHDVISHDVISHDVISTSLNYGSSSRIVRQAATGDNIIDGRMSTHKNTPVFHRWVNSWCRSPAPQGSVPLNNVCSEL